MNEISMKIHPSYFDDECAIVFSLYFNQATREIGEAVIYTCEDPSISKVRNHLGPMCEEDDQKEKIAYLKEFSIVEEYRDLSMKKITHFLNVLGIKKCITINQNEERMYNS